MEVDPIHLRHIMLYEYRRNTSAVQCHRNIISIYGNVIDESTVDRWYQRFRSHNFSLEDEHKSGRPIEIDVDQLKELVETDPRQTTGEMAAILKVSDETIRRHLHNMGTKGFVIKSNISTINYRNITSKSPQI